MSKLRRDKINFEDDDFVVQVKTPFQNKVLIPKEENHVSSEEDKFVETKIDEAKQIVMRAKKEAEEILSNAKSEMYELTSKTNEELDLEKAKILEEAKKNADEILSSANETSKQEAQNLLDTSKEEIEKARIKATNDGYQDGHKEGLEKVQEELEEKIDSFDKFCKKQLEIKNKVIKSASKDILDLVINISKKVLFKELDKESLDKIIKQSIQLLEKKENINIIVSEKYAKLLFELQQNKLDEGTELKFEDFRQYDGFDIVHNPKFDDDTIIVENLKERFDASITTQLDMIIRNIYENTQNGQIDIEEYIEQNETERTE